MEQAKEEIQRNLSKGGVESFMPLWEIIDERWEKQLHSPLHLAGYVLNPQIHYMSGFRDDIKFKHGLHECLTRMVVDPEERAKIEIQLDDFNRQTNLSCFPLAITTAATEIPSIWWNVFGDDLPELKKFACRVLSLTSSSYGGERNKRAFEMVHGMKRNCLRQKTYNDVVYVMANAKLAEEKFGSCLRLLNLDFKRATEGLDVDDSDSDARYMKSLYDMFADLNDEYANGDDDEGEEEDEYGNEDEYGDEGEEGDDDYMED